LLRWFIFLFLSFIALHKTEFREDIYSKKVTVKLAGSLAKYICLKFKLYKLISFLTLPMQTVSGAIC
jgi:hypothetical protein